MHIDFKHLRTIRAIHQTGSLGRAAGILNLTQSALSHQIKALEEQIEMPLFHRQTKPMKLSPAGLKLLRLAERILPELSDLEEEFRSMLTGRAGRLHIALECHACFGWLFVVLEKLRHAWPDVDLDIRQRLAFDALEALRREEVDFVISSDPVDLPGITFLPLFDYEPRLVVTNSHKLAQKSYVDAEDFADELLLTYPVDRSKTDVFTALLTPNRVEPRAVRQVEMTEMILMLVAAKRGIAVLPDWVLSEIAQRPDFKTLPLTNPPITKRMYAAVRAEEATIPYMAHMVRLCKTEPVKLRRK